MATAMTEVLCHFASLDLILDILIMFFLNALYAHLNVFPHSYLEVMKIEDWIFFQRDILCVKGVIVFVR